MNNELSSYQYDTPHLNFWSLSTLVFYFIENNQRAIDKDTLRSKRADEKVRTGHISCTYLATAYPSRQQSALGIY